MRGPAEVDARFDCPTALVLTACLRTHQFVAACSQFASHRGVAPGMTVAHARALLSGVPSIIHPLAPASDRRSIEALAQWAMHFSPVVQADPFSPAPRAGLLLDITGCDRLFRGESNLVSKLVAAVERLGIFARAGIADTVGAAWAMARFASPRGTDVWTATETDFRIAIAPPGHTLAAIAPLPPEALRLDEPTLAGLAEVGLTRIDHLLAIPSDELRQRFGPLPTRRLDQALGRCWEPVEPAAPIESPQAELTLGGPVRKLETITLGVRHLLSQLLADLDRCNLGVRRLELLLDRSDAAPLPLHITLAHASRNEKHLWSLLGPAVERANMGFGVESLRLIARETAELEQTQMALLPDAVPPSRERVSRLRRTTAELVDVLSSRLAPAAVTTVCPMDSHVPERTFAHQSAREFLPRVTSPPASRPALRPGDRLDDRPSVLLDPPEPAAATSLSPDGAVVSLTWQNRRLRVLTCLGPERISPQWWRSRPDRVVAASDRPNRDYYKLQVADDAGEVQWLWLFRARSRNAWFVQGIWQ